MLKIRVIPCLLLKDGGLIKTVKFKEPTYIGDPINAVKIFNEKEVDELIFLDITATINKIKPPFSLLAQITGECFMPFAYGGGIRNLEDAKTIINLGTEKIIINTYAVENPTFISMAAKIFGSQSVVVAIDVKKNQSGRYEIFTHSGTKATGINPINFVRHIVKMGAGELFINAIDRDGTMDGYDIDLIKQMANIVNVPIIACGGAGRIEDFVKAVQSGASAVAAGSMFVFYGPNRAVLINYPTTEELIVLNKFLNYEAKL